MTERIKSIGIEIVSFSLLFLLLGYFTSQLSLYLDDAYFIRPIINKDYLNHFITYISYYGVFRPLALIYYYFIYTLYSLLPGHAHLFPLFIFICTGIIIYKILRLQSLNLKIASVTSLLIVSLPIAVEAYGWFSVNGGIIVYFLFFLQIYLIEKYTPSKKILIIIFIAQFFSTYLYETTIFMPIALGYLWMKKQKIKIINRNNLFACLRTTIFLLVPAFLYLSTFLFISPKIETRIRLINPLMIVDNWKNFIEYILKFSTTKGQGIFWMREYVSGIAMINKIPLTFIIYIILLLLLIKILFSSNPKDGINNHNQYIIRFWIISLLLSLIPLSWQPLYLSFRILLLPTTLLIISFTVFIYLRLEKQLNKLFKLGVIFKISFLLIFTFFISLQVKMLSNYQKQYTEDIKMVKEIKEKVSKYTDPNLDNTYIYLMNLPNNTLDSYIYGDYIFSMFYHYWSAEYFYYYTIGSWKNIAVKLQDRQIFRSRFSENDLLLKRPLFIFEFTNQNDCDEKDCFRIKDARL